METFRRIARIFVGLFFIAAGTYHFVNPAFYLPMMPPYLPNHLELVYLSGAAEVLLGGLCFLDMCREVARVGLTVLLVAIFPANVHMALHPEVTPWATPNSLIARLPFQIVMVLIVWWALARDRDARML